MPHLGAIADGHEFVYSHDLEFELLFALDELSAPHSRAYPLTKPLHIGPRVWSDASFEPLPHPSMRICVIIANQSSKEGVVCDVPNELFAMLIPRKSQIMFGEIYAIPIALRQYPNIVRDESLIAFIDNMAVVHVLANGIAHGADIANVTAAVHHALANLAATAWWEYVNTKSNIADGGSRVGAGCPDARALGIHLRQIPCPLPPPAFPYARPNDWRAFFP